MALTQIYTAVSGDTITSARWNNEFGNLYNNGTDLGFPLTKAVSFAGYTITWDASGVTTIISSASQAFQITPGAKSGTPTTTGGLLNFVASTYTDNNTAGSGTATAWAGWAIQRPTLAATNALVTTTDAATFYIANSPANGANETVTNSWSVWVDAGESRFDAGLGGIGAPCLNELRLTLTTALPVTTADVIGAGTLYLTPYVGSHISLFSGSQWHTYSTAEVSLALTLTSGKPYDVWAYNNAGTVALEVLVWTNDTTRATALAYQNGILVKSGDATRRYLGSLYASGSNTTEDSDAKRYLFNYYNRVHRRGTGVFSTNRTTASATYTELNTEIQVALMIGVSEDATHVTHCGTASTDSAGAGCSTGIAFDSTTVPSFTTGGTTDGAGASQNKTTSCAGFQLLAAGRHYVTICGKVSAGTGTWHSAEGNSTAVNRLTVLFRA